LDNVLKALDGQEKLVFVLEDWDNGVQVGISAPVATFKQAVAAARSKYGDRFSFRAFNPNVDVQWNGEVGIICDEPAPEDSIGVLLEFDLKRHPAMAHFAEALCPDDPKKNLRPFRIKAVLLKGGQGVFWRFVELTQEGGEKQ
jgi:hypothetical protein